LRAIRCRQSKQHNHIEAVTDTHSTHHVLIVEDDAVTRARLVAYFEAENYRVSQSEDGADIHRLIAESAIDVVLLDINLPGKDGLQLARELSEKTDVGIILVTARNDEVDRIVGLEIGADDYVSKPFNPRELLARVKNLIRRKQSDQTRYHKQRSKSFSGWTLDLSRRCLSSNTQENLPLTRAEFELLVTFLEHPGKTLHREWLMEKVTHRVWSPNERTIDVIVLRLRSKIEHNSHAPQIILTVHGEGYLFASEVF
jgi:two-component system torCAD operon response regulator TorR